MEKIILFYKYVVIPNPHQIREWFYTLCTNLHLKGRILLACEGINATVGGSVESLEQFKATLNAHPLFGNIDFKESDGSADHFPRLQVTVKKEIVNLSLDTEKYTAQNGGKHLKPSEVHELLNNKPDNLVVFDARNDFEWKIGKFRDAITPNIPYFRYLPEYIDKNPELFKDKQVLMYCTGGIRCERASAYLKSKEIAQEVYQIEGGIHRYVEQYPDGHFRGKNYVFDARVAVRVNEDVVGLCDICTAPYDEVTNCINAACNKQVIVCPNCMNEYNNTCSAACKELVAQQKVNVRLKPKKLFNQEESGSCQL